MLRNCSLQLNDSVVETENDKDLPVVTRELLARCEPIKVILKAEIKKKTRYRYEVVGDEQITFKMLRNNVSQLVFQLDWVRKNRRKFVCLNDNLDHNNQQVKNIRIVLKDFYESLFPEQSQFELPTSLRNKFLTTEHLQAFREKVRDKVKLQMNVFYFGVFILAVFFFRRKIHRMYQALVHLFSRRRNGLTSFKNKRDEIMKI